MQTELEQWIEEHSGDGHVGPPVATSPPYVRKVVSVDDLRTLLEDKVLCNAEPVAWMNPYTEETFNEPEPGDVPLYAPASLAGNADISPQGEAGKEGA
jgi:hypothetical protein